MLILILTHTPLWVWGLLCGLVLLGLLQTRARRVARSQLLALPLALLVLGLWSMARGMAAQPLLALAWLGSLVLFAQLGLRLPRPASARWLAAEARLQLPGSWLPMLLILTIFSLRYGTGVALALHAEWRTALGVQLPLALLFGALSGVFLGRALGLLQLTQMAASTMLAHEPLHRV